MSRMKNPERLKSRSCKIGTIPSVVIVDGRCRVSPGSRIRVRDAIHMSEWHTVVVTRVLSDGYFFADRC